MVNKVLKFSATWCAPCRALGETLSKVEDITIENVDIDDNEELCEKYNIRSVPTLIFLNNENKAIMKVNTISFSDVPPAASTLFIITSTMEKLKISMRGLKKLKTIYRLNILFSLPQNLSFS